MILTYKSKFDCDCAESSQSSLVITSQVRSGAYQTNHTAAQEVREDFSWNLGMGVTSCATDDSAEPQYNFIVQVSSFILPHYHSHYEVT